MGKDKMGMDAHFVTLCPVTLFLLLNQFHLGNDKSTQNQDINKASKESSPSLP